MPHQDSLFIHPSSGNRLTSGRLSYWLAGAIKRRAPEALKPAGQDIHKMATPSITFTPSTQQKASTINDF